MELTSLVIELIFTAVILWYCITVLRWFLSWQITETLNSEYSYAKPVRISVIVAVRNEADNIVNCLNALINQNSVAGQFEIIISDDFSSDQTVNLVKDFIAEKKHRSFDIQILKGENDQPSGKKAALERAIAVANGELIVTTDADCIMNRNWLNSINKLFQESHVVMITGFVKVLPTTNFLSWFEALDVLSLSGTGAISIIDEKPIMCNGANLAFTKKAFFEVGGYAYGKNDPSGDDTYLMLKMANMYPTQIKFNKNRDGIVTTSASINFKSLISQRIRWSSKVKNYKEEYIMQLGLFLLFVNISLVCLFGGAIAGVFSWSFVVIIWILKIIADLILLLPLSTFADQRKLLLLILPAQLLYPVYMVVGAVVSLLDISFIWKGRTTSRVGKRFSESKVNNE